MQIGVGVTNALINARKALDKNFAGEAEDVPILSTSVAYGVYMAVSSNLRYVYLLSNHIIEVFFQHLNEINLATSNKTYQKVWILLSSD